MFAIKRTDRVIGRITLLIDSINTIKGIKAEGVLWGTKWANIWVVWFNHPNNINLSHKGKASVNVIVKWLEDVKIYGNNPRKLLNTINKNNEINMIVDPWRADGPNNVLNSEWSLITIIFIKIFLLFEISQYEGVIIIKIVIDLSQLSDKLKLAAGSNTENKLVIIFSLFF